MLIIGFVLKNLYLWRNHLVMYDVYQYGFGITWPRLDEKNEWSYEECDFIWNCTDLMLTDCTQSLSHPTTTTTRTIGTTTAATTFENIAIFDCENSQQPEARLEDETTIVWRYPLSISQSSLCGKTELSNACTLIALKIAQLIHNHDIGMIPIRFKNNSQRASGGSDLTTLLTRKEIEQLKMEAAKGPLDSNDSGYIDVTQKCPEALSLCLINGIIDGNENYMNDAGENRSRIYNLPDAIKACGGDFKEIDFTLCTNSIVDDLPKMLRIAINCPMFSHEKRLFFVMIGCIRTVLIVYDRCVNSLTIFDTHMHYWEDVNRNVNIRHGAIIATARYEDVNDFAMWIHNFVFPDIALKESEFEISLVQVVDESKRNNCYGLNSLQYPKRVAVFPKNAHKKSSLKKNHAPAPKLIDDYTCSENLLTHPILRKLLSSEPAQMKRKRCLTEICDNCYCGMPLNKQPRCYL